MPAAAWDAHAHVIGDPDLFPFSPGRSYTPPPAPLSAYLAMLDRHGLAHGVLVQPSVYGVDNGCLLDALDRAGGRLFGVVVPPADACARDLEAMHRRGVRGVRCNLINPGGLSPETVVAWAPVLRALGWHVELHVAVEALANLRAFVGQFGVPVPPGPDVPANTHLPSGSMNEIAFARFEPSFAREPTIVTRSPFFRLVGFQPCR